MASVHRPRLWLRESAAAEVRRAAAAAHPVEIGGVLLGVYVARQRPWVVQAVVVPSQGATHSSYELPAGARPAAVDSARQVDRRMGYLGDWHSHPADVGPSDTDVATMKALAENDSSCPHPVLLLVRRMQTGYRLDARQLARRKLRKLRIIATGGLPSDTSSGTRRTRGSRR